MNPPKRSWQEQQWKPGQSGNPSGRPKSFAHEIRNMARKDALQAYALLRDKMLDGDVGAAKDILRLAGASFEAADPSKEDAGTYTVNPHATTSTAELLEQAKAQGNG